MRRKVGPADISYCSTSCRNERCKRNLNYYKPPFRYFSCTHFDDANDKDELHLKCKWKLEDKNDLFYKRPALGSQKYNTDMKIDHG